MYQISWARQIGLLLGHTTHASSVVLSSFFAGMAIGYGLGQTLSSGSAPLKRYGLAELLIGVWAILIPTILATVRSTALLQWLTNDSASTQTLIRSAFCLTLLLPATASMGATLPLMAEHLSRRRCDARSISFAYAVNTAGALLGVILATCVLLLTVGVTRSSYLAAGLSALSGLAAIAIAKQSNSDRQLPADRVATVARHNQISPGLCYAIVIVSGFTTLAMEVLYARLFSLIFHNSTYTFGLIVAVFLAALATGAAITPILLQRMPLRKLLAVNSGIASVAIGGSVMTFIRLTDLDYFSAGDSFTEYLLGGALLAVAIVFPSVVVLGTILPLVWHGVISHSATRDRHGGTIGGVTMWNSAAAAVGSLTVSYYLLPTIGLWHSFVAMTLLQGITAVALLWTSASRKSATATLGIVVCLCGLMVGQANRWGQSGANAHDTIVQRWESAYGWIDVTKNRNGSVWSVRQNLHYRHGATGETAMAERRQALVPLLLHEDPASVMFMGFGTGVTASGALPFEDVRAIRAVELIPEVLEAAKLLADFNDHVASHPKVTIRIDDARHDLLANDTNFDVIVSDLFVPWESHTGYLYTVEHYETVRSRLNNDGLFCQWLPLYQLGPREFEAIANSFAATFPTTTVCWGQLNPDWPTIGLIGTEQSIAVNPTDFNRRCAELRQTAVYRAEPLLSADRLLKHIAGTWPSPNAAQRRHLNTDEHPRVEFLTPLSRQNHQLLSGGELRNYYTRVLAKLPPANIILTEAATVDISKQRRAWHRSILLGE